ncbi:hypothetical protein GM708_05160 [Vibrio cholerae]|nr:hypothetical protein [Vibrio cholerae]
MDSSALMLSTPELLAVVRGRLSTIARNTGRFGDAVDLARQAVAHAAGLPEHAPARLQAAFILIAALSVKGDLDEAWEVAMALDISESVPAVPSLLVARGAWAIGNVAFRRGEIEIGMQQHALTARLLLPQADLEAWSEFHRASAVLKMQAGIVDESVRHSVSNAERGTGILARAEQIAEVAIAKAYLALLTDDLASAGTLLQSVDGQRDLLDFESTTDLEYCLGKYFAARRAPEQAAYHLRKAARLYSEAGAEERALELMEQMRAL